MPSDVRDVLSEVYKRSLRRGLTTRESVAAARTITESINVDASPTCFFISGPIAPEALAVWLPLDTQSAANGTGYEEWIRGGHATVQGSGTIRPIDGTVYEGVTHGSGTASLRYAPANTLTVEIIQTQWTIEFWLTFDEDISTTVHASAVFSEPNGRTVGVLRDSDGNMELWCRDTDGQVFTTESMAERYLQTQYGADEVEERMSHTDTRRRLGRLVHIVVARDVGEAASFYVNGVLVQGPSYVGVIRRLASDEHTLLSDNVAVYSG